MLQDDFAELAADPQVRRERHGGVLRHEADAPPAVRGKR